MKKPHRYLIGSILIFVLIIASGINYAAKNHYLCDGAAGPNTRALENKAKSWLKYPRADRYALDASCGFPDGVPTASVYFHTKDSMQQVFDYYSSRLRVTARGENQLCTDQYCLFYRNSTDKYLWWNVEIDQLSE